MIDHCKIEEALSRVKNQESFLQILLAETLNWPLRETTKEVRDASFEWTAEELRASGLDKHIVENHIWQLRRFDDNQVWGVFIIEFKNVDAFTKGRGLTGFLRKILRGLVPSARRRSDLVAWKREYLLFICTHNYQHYQFAYFKAPKETKLAPLATFGWSPEIPCRTACEFNLPPLEWPENPTDSNAWVRKWQEAFDKEKLTKVFFEQYKEIFDDLEEDLAGQTKNRIWAHDYALQFLNRCMFIHFIQRKGWLNDDTNFFKTFWSLYKNSSQSKDTFFEKWLKILFFEAFNKKFPGGGHKHLPQQINNALQMAPYLNGGLFKENDLDKKIDFSVTDKRFEKIHEFFEHYNFTVSEDTPFDKDVAVDPEMIGMVYESLVNKSESEDERSEAGIFYTPRVEIDLMCRLSLVDYLSNHLSDNFKPLLYNWIFCFESSSKTESDKAVEKSGLKEKLKELISEIAVLDPACGSGSFLVGMLGIIDDLKERLDRLDKKTQSIYERRKEIIGSSLYGVDVKDWACHIAELRLWLSLIVDADFKKEELSIRKEPLLPHFSFKIRFGDSLVQEIGGLDLAHRRGSTDIPKFIKDKLRKLQNEKNDFYNNKSSDFSENDIKNDEVLIFKDLLEYRRKIFFDEAKELMRLQAKPPDEQILLDGTLETKSKQIMLDREVRERTIKEKMEESARLESIKDSLRDISKVPFVWDISFAEIFESDKDGFDIVIGNPPYVRQESIANPNPHIDRNKITSEDKKKYKAKLARSIYKAYPNYFGYKPSSEKAEKPLDAKSDLYIYFYFKGLSLLNDKGSFCFITSNSWLDVGYGSDLQEFLLKRCSVKFIIDNNAKRSFKSADINTIIVLFGAPQDKKVSDEVSLQKQAKFVLFSMPFEGALNPVVFNEIDKIDTKLTAPEYRILPIKQSELLKNGCEIPEESEEKKNKGPLIKIAKYIGDKWGGKYLRAPDIYWTILEKGKDKLIHIGDIAEVRRGFTTGCNEFFYLDEEKIKQWGIEPEFLKPVIKSPKECKRVIAESKYLNNKVFLCDKTQKELKTTRALEYIKWGESEEFDRKPTCAARILWYNLGHREYGDFVQGQIINDRFVFTKNSKYLVDCVLNEVMVKSQSQISSLSNSLNCSLNILFIEMNGRKALGEGGLKIQVEIMRELSIVNPALVPQENFISEDRDILSVVEEFNCDDRKKLDSIIFNILKFSKSECDAVYEAIINLVESRLKKAASLED